MDKNRNKIFVTKTFLPPLAEYTNYLQQIWEKRWVTNHGDLSQELENRLKEHLGVKHVFFVSNGTMAIQLAIKAMGIKKSIITTPFTFVATTSAILWENCVPVFVDIDPESFSIDTNKIEQAITKDTEAILAVHVYGYPCDVKAIDKIAKKHNLKVVYDAAHAFGVEIDGKSIFQFGDISILSLHATKLFHTGEGGLLVTNNDKLARKIKLLRDFGFDGEMPSELGINGKNSELHAALGLANLKYVDSIIKVRGRLVEEYKKLLVGTSLHEVKYSNNVEYNHAYFPVLFKNEKELLTVKQMLEKENIFSRRYFYPSLNTLPFVDYVSCPVSESIAKRVLCLPLYHDLSITTVRKITEIIKNTLESSLPTVTIGISAYNEEKNIRNILTALLRQKQTHWSLDKIIVACGGCTDNSVEYAQSIHSDKIEVIVNKKREGKAVDEQKIINAFDSDYLVMVDADILPANDFVIDNLIATFLRDDKISLVGGNPRPFQPTSFFEKAVYTTFFVLDKSRKFVKGGNSIYGCSGQCLAMKKEFAKTIKFPPKIVAEDDYIYFSCISSGRIFRHCPSAIVYYKLPKTLEDYIKQIFRADPDASTRNVQEYFGKIVSDEYHRPFKPYARVVLQAFIKNPLGASLMIFIRLLSKPLGPIVSRNYKTEWFTANSTK